MGDSNELSSKVGDLHVTVAITIRAVKNGISGYEGKTIHARPAPLTLDTCDDCTRNARVDVHDDCNGLMW